MQGVGENFAKFVRSYSSDSDINAKDVSSKSVINMCVCVSNIFSRFFIALHTIHNGKRYQMHIQY